MKSFLITLCLFLFSCKYETLPDGRQYRIRTRCVESHQEAEIDYHYGGRWSVMKGEFVFDWHWPMECFSGCSKTICDKQRIDTIWKK